MNAVPITTRQLLQHVQREHFQTFVQSAWPILHNGAPLAMEWGVRAICHHLDLVAHGQTRRLIISAPPRTGKSTIASVIWPAFMLGRNPAGKLMSVTYGDILSLQLSGDCRRLMESPFYRNLFPEVVLETAKQELLQTDQGGQRFATTIGGAVTGMGADYILVDDPLKAEDAYSDPARDGVNRFFRTTLSSRLNNPSEGAIVIVAQRLHADDLVGDQLRQAGWEHLRLQAEAEEDQVVEIDYGVTHQVRRGDLLSSSRLSRAVLDHQRQALGSSAFAAQYQQNPTPAGGNMIKRDWLKYYDKLPNRSGRRVIISLDTASKTGVAHDYSVATVWLNAPGEHHLMHVWRDKVLYPEMKQKVTELYRTWGADVLLIEDQGAGTSLLQELKRTSINAIGCKPTKQKEARLASASAAIEAGKMYLPREADWLADVLSELLSFPAGRHDDIVDSLSQYFNWVRDNPPSLFSYDMGYGPSSPRGGALLSSPYIDHDAIADYLISRRW